MGEVTQLVLLKSGDNAIVHAVLFMPTQPSRQQSVPGQQDVGHPRPDLPDLIRPEWRAVMLLVLRGGIAAYAGGDVPTLGAPDQRTLLLEQALSVADRFPRDLLLGLYRHGTDVARKTRVHRARNSREFQQVARDMTALSFEMNLAPMLALVPHLLEFITADHEMRAGWWVATNLATLHHWRTFFPIVLRVARDGDDRDARVALWQAIVVEKSVVYLPWVRERFECSRALNDQGFFTLLGRALSAPPVPLLARTGALDMGLAIFDCWLREMPLAGQVALIREGGVAITTKALRNRRSRLGLGVLDRESLPELSPANQRLIAEYRAMGLELFQNR